MAKNVKGFLFFLVFGCFLGSARYGKKSLQRENGKVYILKWENNNKEIFDLVLIFNHDLERFFFMTVFSCTYWHHPESFIAVIGNEDFFYVPFMLECATKEPSHCISPDLGHLKVRELVRHECTPHFCGESDFKGILVYPKIVVPHCLLDVPASLPWQ